MKIETGNNSKTEGKPWLSVIIPVYNGEKHLDKTIHSILSQTFTDFELLLIDDGSTDKSPEICKKYEKADNRVIYMKKENGGPFQARLVGIEKAQGTYFTFCDADDYYANSKVFSVLHQYLNAGTIDMLQFGYKKKYNHLSHKENSVNKRIDLDKTRFQTEEYPLLLCSFYESSHLTTNVWNKVYKKSCSFHILPSNEAKRVFWGEDLILNLYLLNDCAAVTYVSDILYVYRDLTGGTASFSTRSMTDLDIIKQFQLKFTELSNLSDKTRIINTMHSETACWFLEWIREGVRAKAMPELKEMIAESLKLPSFIAARDYFLYENDLDWTAIELLRKADPDLYIEEVQQHGTAKYSFKSKIKNLYKII